MLGSLGTTIRNNLWIMSSADNEVGCINIQQWDAGASVPDDIDIYNESIYSSSAQVINFVVNNDGTNVTVRNCLAWEPNSTGAPTMTSGTVTASNNSSNAQIIADTPNSFVGSNGDGTGTFTSRNHFKLLAGSYAVAGGSELPLVLDDYFGNIRNIANMDIGFHAFTQGSLPGGEAPLVLPQTVLFSQSCF